MLPKINYFNLVFSIVHLNNSLNIEIVNFNKTIQIVANFNKTAQIITHFLLNNSYSCEFSMKQLKMLLSFYKTTQIILNFL